MLLVLTALIALQLSAVQTFLSKKVGDYLSHELEATITLDKVYFKPFSALEIVNFKWQDKYGKTVLAVGSLNSKFDLSQLLKNKVEIKEIKVNKGYINFEIFKDSTNLSNAIRYFSTPSNIKKGKSNPLVLKLDKIVFTDNQLKLINHNYKHHNKGVDFSDIAIQQFSAEFTNIKLDSIWSADISDFTLKEKSGLFIKKLTTQASYSKHQMEFKDLYLETNRSILQDYVKLTYDHIYDFEDFMQKVQVTGNIRSSKIASRDIELFAPDLKNILFDVAIKQAKLSGTVEKIRAKNVYLTTGKQTVFDGNFTIDGLPNINKTIFDFTIKSLKTNTEDIEKLTAQLSNQKKFTLPQQLQTLGLITFTGGFKGLYHNFQVNGQFNTRLGDIHTASTIALKKSIHYDGQIRSSLFHLGKFLGYDDIKNTGFDFIFSGEDVSFDDLTLTFDGHFNQTTFKDYQYNKLVLSGKIANKLGHFKGAVEDKNLNAELNTSIDWATTRKNYLLEAKINHAALVPLKITQRDSIILQSGNITTNIHGNTLNSAIGRLYADSIKIYTSKGNFEIPNIDFVAEGDELKRSLSLKSDVLDAQLQGNIDLNTILPYFKSLAMRYAPASAIPLTPYNPQNFNINLRIKSFQPIASLIDPNLTLDDGAYLNAEFSSDKFTAKFDAFSPTLTYKGYTLKNLAIQEDADDKAFSIELVADRFSLSDSLYIDHIRIQNNLANDSLLFKVEVAHPNAANYLNLVGNIHFAPNAPALIKFDKSRVVINNDNWQLNNDGLLRISKGKIYIKNLLLKQGQQQITFNGIASNENDQVAVLFKNFNLSSLNGFTKPRGIQLQGKLNGDIILNSIFNSPTASANIETSPIIYNSMPIGTLLFKADYDPMVGIANLDINLLDEQKRGLKLGGTYNFLSHDLPLQLKGEVAQADLILLQPLMSNLVSDLRGRISADLTINGTLNNPKLSGLARIHEAEFMVNYLRAPFKVNNQISLIEKNSLLLQNFIFNDLRGKTAKVEGIVNLSKLVDPYIDVDIQANNIMLLNTTLKDNSIYYGTAYATGTFEFKGNTSALNIDIEAKSESGTTINLPFNSAMTITDSDFIYFIDKNPLSNKSKERKSLFKGLTMNMDLNLNRNAEVNLQTNLGSLKGTGDGTITMKISSLGDFEMFGDYVVYNGKFHFTAQDFFNKYFDLKEGGTIRWSGKPSEANINVNALYQQRTSISPLYNAAGRDVGQDERVLAQADMLIKGTLEQPDISFDLNFPQNPYIKDQLQSYLSDLNNVNQQALSLIVRRSFTPSTTEQIGKEVNNTLLSAGAEIAFNQLNNIISQSLNINFFDLNIRSFNDASASVRLWDDRLVLTGGITDRTNIQANDLSFFREGVTTDAELTYKLRKDGNLMLRGYNRPYTRNFLLRSSDSEYISALGLVYRQEFNSINEFWRKLWKWRGIKKENTKGTK